jgi:hypothetical protein
MDKNSSALHEPETGDTHRLIPGTVPVIFPFNAYGIFFQQVCSPPRLKPRGQALGGLVSEGFSPG